MSPIGAIYLIIFLPLIFSLFCQIFSQRKICFSLSISCLSVLFFLIIAISGDVFTQKIISSNIDIFTPSIGLEFKIDKASWSFLLTTIFAHFVIFLYYGKFFEHKNYHHFCSLFLLKIFAAIGIITTNNFFNLFLFLEIYAICLLAIFAIIDNKKSQLNLPNYFLQNSAASLILLFSMLMIYFNYNSFSIEIFKDNFFSTKKDFRFFAIISFFFACGFLVKFFPVQFYLKNIEDNNILHDTSRRICAGGDPHSKTNLDIDGFGFCYKTPNFALAELIFIAANLGIFLTTKFSYLFFTNKIVLFTLILLALSLIIYFLLKLLNAQKLKIIAIYFSAINLLYLFIATAFDSEKSSLAAYFYLLNFALVNSLFFIFTNFLQQKFLDDDVQNISVISDKPSLMAALSLLLIFLIAFPFTFLFLGNWYFVLENLQFHIMPLNSLILLVLATSNLIFVFVVLNILNKIFINK